MVILANRHRSYNGDTRTPSISSERETHSVNTPLATNLDEGSFLPNHLRGEMAPDTRRNLYLSLTLTTWTPLPPQGLWLKDTTVGRNGLLTPNTSSSRSRLITSASPAASTPARPLTAIETEIRSNSLAERQHATDRFPRFAYLLRHGTPLPEHQTDDRHGTAQPGSQLDDRCSRRSADPHSASGRAHASVATIPDARTQCGVCDETGLQSCAAASACGTLGPSSPPALSSPSRVTTSASDTPPVLLELPASEPALEDQQRSDSPSCTVSMASYHSASSSSRGGSRTEQLLAHTRKGAHCMSGERMTGETPLSYASSQNQPHGQASTQHEEVDEDDQDQDQPDSPPGSGSQTNAEGQPKKKKTRRAGVAITRVRRLQREVRRLAEEEEANAQRQPQPSLLLGVQVPPASPISSSATSPTARQFQGLPFTGAASPPPRGFTSPVGSLARTSTERQPRSETPQAGLAAHPRGPAYDRILEDGDDVVLLRLPGVVRAPGSSIWAIRPEERPRGGSS